MLKENITTFAYIYYYIDILYSLFLSGLLLSLFVCLLLVKQYFLFYSWCIYMIKGSQENTDLDAYLGTRKPRLHYCLHTGQEFLLVCQYTETPSLSPYVYVQSAILPPIKMFSWSHFIKTFSPKLEVPMIHIFLFFNLTINRLPQGPSFHNQKD